MIRVVRLVPSLTYGGVESRILTLARGIDASAFELTVCSLQTGGMTAAALMSDGHRVAQLGQRVAVRDIRTTLSLYRYLRKTRPHILHTSIAEANFHGSIAGLLSRIPVRIVEEVGIPRRSLLATEVLARLYGTAHAVVTVSKACSSAMLEQGVPADRVQLIYNCVRQEFLEVPPAGGAARTPFRVCSVGRLVWQKDYPTLIRASALLIAEGYDLRLDIAGDGPLAKELAALVASLGVGDRITLSGATAHVRAFLANADAFVLPSVSEAFGISLAEAMAQGVPVIASASGGMPEIMQGLEKWLFPAGDVRQLADRLRALIGLPTPEYVALRGEVRQVATARFSPQAYVAGVEALYRRLAESRMQTTGSAGS